MLNNLPEKTQGHVVGLEPEHLAPELWSLQRGRAVKKGGEEGPS